MTQQRGSYYQGAAHEQAGTLSDQIAEGAKSAADKTVELAGDALDQVDEWLNPIGLSIKEKPMTCLAVLGGIAFAAGAVWMLRSSRQQSQLSNLVSQLGDYKRRVW
jgi:hypothetical protein